MYDPVIIVSGQTYERIFIERWFSDGHNSCPKTQQELPHLGLTPNYCVKGLVASWCEQNGISIPEGPSESLDLNYCRLLLSESESFNSKSMENIVSCKFKGVKVGRLEESSTMEEAEGNEVDESMPAEDDGITKEAQRNEVDEAAMEGEFQVNSFDKYDEFLGILDKEDDLWKKCKVVEEIRHLLKDDEEVRMYMGADGFIEALLRFLDCALHNGDEIAQEIGAMALFNLGVNNNRSVITVFYYAFRVG
ncbi:hypothetical protein RND71_026329 [Anisodus tanguticus]|uniref:RING-type E3 ubiquitin transferase n=1 Tax=Anisodus tanguticus TaxID=243964 RepID=A0AAE1RM70_9SOLA|nr:hypothetical protein RND71_026329 [Anisodus tanguticus]